MPRFDMINRLTQQKTDPAIEYQKAQKKDMQKVIAHAIKENYYNDENYYQQVQAMAMQYGIPIAPPKMDPAKTFAGAALNLGTLGFADLLGVTDALGLSSISPQGKKIQNAAGWIGALMPWGWGGLGIKAASKVGVGMMGGKVGSKVLGQTLKKSGLAKAYGLDKVGAQMVKNANAASKTTKTATKTAADLADDATILSRGKNIVGGSGAASVLRGTGQTAAKASKDVTNAIKGLDMGTKDGVIKVLGKRGKGITKDTKLDEAADQIIAALGSGGEGVLGGKEVVKQTLRKMLKKSKGWSQSDIIAIMA